MNAQPDKACMDLAARPAPKAPACVNAAGYEAEPIEQLMVEQATGRDLGEEAPYLVADGERPARPEGTTAGPNPLVSDVMLRHPKTLPAHASIEEARAALANDHVHMVLLTDGRALVGTLVRTDLPRAAAPAGPALRWSKLVSRTVPPGERADAVQNLLVERGIRRVAVVDPDGTLLGLMCLKRRRTGFCSDSDVASRARSHDAATPQIEHQELRSRR